MMLIIAMFVTKAGANNSKSTLVAKYPNPTSLHPMIPKSLAALDFNTLLQSGSREVALSLKIVTFNIFLSTFAKSLKSGETKNRKFLSGK